MHCSEQQFVKLCQQAKYRLEDQDCLDYSNQGLSAKQFLHLLSFLRKNPQGLKDLVFSHNHIGTLTPGCFHGLHQLEHLDLSNNALTHVDPENFSGVFKLRTLKIEHNRVKQLPPGCFRKCHALSHLNLGNNLIDGLQKECFIGLSKLKTLDLNNNKISTLKQGAFQYLSKMNALNLSENRLTRLIAQTFKGLKSLKKLFLGFNIIEQFDATCFNDTPNLRAIDFNGNPIVEICSNDRTKAMDLDLLMAVQVFTDHPHFVTLLKQRHLELPRCYFQRQFNHLLEQWLRRRAAN